MEFIGIDPSEHVVSRAVLDAGESARGYKAFEEDPYGVGAFLHGKRKARGWKDQYRELWDESMGDGVLELLLWSGGKSGKERCPSQLPWDIDDQLSGDVHGGQCGN